MPSNIKFKEEAESFIIEIPKTISKDISQEATETFRNGRNGLPNKVIRKRYQ